MAKGADPPPGTLRDRRTYTRTEAAVLDATERLLARRPFSELSVNDVIDEAGVSRTSFYVYFDSRTAVVAECLRRVTGQIAVAVDPFLAESETDPEAAIRASIRRWLAVARDHGPVLRTVSEQWPHDDRLRELWFSIMARFTAGTARVIETARGAGQAPGGADAERLAACLMWGYERVLQVATADGDATGLPDAEAIVEPLAQMMTGGVYGLPAPSTGR
jgi:TetR/AcrR family transcriptional regulator, ethionamide resistance regulator